MTRNVYAVGCRWGDNAPTYEDIFMSKNIAVAGINRMEKYDIKERDLLCLKIGHNIIAIGEVLSYNKKATWKDVGLTREECNDYWFQINDSVGICRIKKWINVNIYYPTRGTFFSINKDDVRKKCIEKYDKQIQMHTKDEKMNEYIELLKVNKNIIFTGAPGTGKTYMAREIAINMILGEAKVYKDLTDEEKAKLEEYSDFVQFHPSYDYTDFVEGLRPVKTDDHKNIGFERKNGIFKEFCEKAKKNLNANYVFIIDEINRGEISKIFGELFFSIDPGYRGSEGRVKTQYSNLIEDEKEFYVPENVYIIGTMNDIDRSVESMDFAIRRRFAWVEIKAEDRISMWDGKIDEDKDEAKKRMINLNKKIAKIEGLSSAYHIGPSYFLKLKNGDDGYDGDFDDLWNYHIKGVLFEYLRGMPNAQEEMDKLQAAYNLAKYEEKNNLDDDNTDNNEEN